MSMPIDHTQIPGAYYMNNYTLVPGKISGYDTKMLL